MFKSFIRANIYVKNILKHDKCHIGYIVILVEVNFYFLLKN